MKTVLLIWLSIGLLFQGDLDTLRHAFKQAGMDKDQISAFYKLTEAMTLNNQDPIRLAYRGAALCLKAKTETKLKDKKQRFIEGVSLLEKAIAQQPEQIESRFIRLIIQQNTPKVLKYKDHIEDDLSYIQSHLKELKQGVLKAQITDYLSHKNSDTIRVNKP